MEYYSNSNRINHIVHGEDKMINVNLTDISIGDDLVESFFGCNLDRNVLLLTHSQYHEIYFLSDSKLHPSK